MRNPLKKRYIRELKGDFAKYAIILLLMVIAIGFTSGFLVADGSMIKAYNESFEKYNIEDGNFIAESAMNAQKRASVEENGITVYDNFYYEAGFENGSDLRIFKKRGSVNLECLMSGRFPESAGEIAIDRMYAQNNGLSEDDVLVSDDGTGYVVTGLVALPDYSALFKDNNDIMFDASQFCVAIVTEAQFDTYDNDLLTYCYSWKYDDAAIAGSESEKDAADDLMYAIGDDVVLKSFIPRYLNQAITFTGEDMGTDGAMMTAFLYIVVAIIAFVFAITTMDTISKEARVIGTLRASGFTRAEMVRHYMVMPIAVILVSAVVGNILGYTFMKDICAGLYYGSYSLPTYVTVWSPDAFLKTTVVPCLIMAAVIFVTLIRGMSPPPLKFLRGNLAVRKNKKAVRLSHGIPFMSRFHLRVIFQNMPSYAILLIGILFGNILLMFGLALPQLLVNYQENIADNMIANYQYILNVPSDVTDGDNGLGAILGFVAFSKAVETQNPDAEEFSAYELKTDGDGGVRVEDIMLYGISDDSRYVTLPSTGTYISYAYADKYGLGSGDSITLYEEYEDKSYTMEIAGVIDYNGAVCVFMPMGELNAMMEWDTDFFTGYFSDSVITDIDEKYIASVIDYDSLTKVSRQLMISMGGLMYMIDVFSIVMFLVIMYLLSKMIIEKNAHSISMTKILGYGNAEISRIYIRPITIVTFICIAISLPICDVILRVLYRVVMRQMMSGWLSIDISPKVHVIMAALGVATYIAVAMIEMRRIKKIPMDMVLKAVE